MTWRMEAKVTKRWVARRQRRLARQLDATAGLSGMRAAPARYAGGYAATVAAWRRARRRWPLPTGTRDARRRVLPRHAVGMTTMSL